MLLCHRTHATVTMVVYDDDISDAAYSFNYVMSHFNWAICNKSQCRSV